MLDIGTKYGDLEIICRLHGNLYLCKCKCGRRKRIIEQDILNNYSNYTCTHKTNIKDITGQRFGDWLALYPTKSGYWMCECQCENKTRKEIYGTTLRSGESTSCGHNTTGFKDLKGLKFGEWTVLEYTGNHYWKCQCSCKDKTERDVHRYSLLSGKSTSCGCKSVEKIQKSLITNNITQYRTDEQINIVSSADNMLDYIKKLGYEPTISDLSNLLSLNRTSIGVYIHKYRLEEYVDINSAVSNKEKELREFIESIYSGNIIYNSRIIIQGQELDIYIPEKQIAIEFNGNYWHSDIFKDKKYHQQKTINCYKNKIRLIHIFEYEWDNLELQDKIKKILTDILCTKEKIYARNTEISIIDNSIAKDFENKYHLLGGINAQISLGCYYKNQLLGIMTFGKPRFSNESEYEIIRECFKPGVTVVGIKGKMISTFEKIYKPKSIVSYCNIAKFSGISYIENGFKADKDSITEPGYVWVDTHGNKVLSRYQTKKSKLIKSGLGTENNTEDEIMKSFGFLKIYNSGNIKFIKEYR